METVLSTTTPTRLRVRLATSPGEVRAAQRLRWQVFADEQGATIQTPIAGHDIDDLDQHCLHLIVIDEALGAVIGTYRLLTADAAHVAGGYYSEQEFDLSALKRAGMKLLELGRSCVLPSYRTGYTIALLWSGLAWLLAETRHDALIGCASIPLKHNAAAAARLAHQLYAAHRGPADLLVAPRRVLPIGDGPMGETAAAVPPLLKGYLRSGAVVCGEPCWDPDFDCADLLLYLPVEQMASRYARRFLAHPPAIGVAGSSPCHISSVQLASAGV